jgi:hypothetical protein
MEMVGHPRSVASRSSSGGLNSKTPLWYIRLAGGYRNMTGMCVALGDLGREGSYLFWSINGLHRTP